MLDACGDEFLPSVMGKRNPPSLPALCLIVCALCAVWAGGVRADDRSFRLAVPEALVETGLLRHLVPRFTLKTGVRVEIVAAGSAAEAALGTAEGRAVFEGEGGLWRLALSGTHPGAARFADWLGSEIGLRTVAAYEVEGRAPFTPARADAPAEATPRFEGDAAAGRQVAQSRCGRCHVVEAARRMTGIGSTPSFAVLRALPDWSARFQSFYALRPHPAFTQIAGVTEPFAQHLPPPIVPVEITPGDLEAILAYVAQIAPADLGAPIQLQ